MIENPLLYIKQPYLCVIDTSYTFYDRHRSKCIILAVNVIDEDVRISKGITICLACVDDVTEVHCNTEPVESINKINDVNTEMNESVTNEVVPKDTLTLIHPDSSFMYHKDFYPKPRITLLDAELSDESKQQLNDLLEEFSDIMSKMSWTSV